MPGVGEALCATPSLQCHIVMCPSSSRSFLSSVSPLQHILIRPPREKCCLRSLGTELARSSVPSLNFSRNRRASVSLSASSPSSSPCTSSYLGTKNSDNEEDAVVEPASPFLLKNLSLGFWTGIVFLSAAAGAPAEVIEIAPEASEGTPTDYLLTFLFFAAFLGLSILSIGVVYLSVSDFLENRQRTAAQNAAGEKKKDKKGEKRDSVKVGSGKGFGVKKVDTEEDS